MAKNTKGGLGRGLNSLLSGVDEEAIPPEKPEKKREVVEIEEVEEPVKKASKPTTAKTPIAKETSAKETSKKEENTPFDEGDDHVVIKEVKERSVVDAVVEKGDTEVPIDLVQPNPDQPRTNFKKEEIEELASSIEREGLLQPILVRPLGKGYQIIAGERRWQACKSNGMKKVPIRVREVDDDKALELALIENIQRSDLNPIEEAYGYRRLMERKGMTQSEVAETVSKGRSTVANAMRLLELPEDAQQLLFEEKISSGHARAILSIPTNEGRQRLTEKMVKEKISVRESEVLARLFAGAQKKEGSSNRVPTPIAFKNVARELRGVLQTNVKVKTVQGKNKIEIEFKDEEELERLFEKISGDKE